MDAAGSAGNDRWEVSLSDRGIRDSKDRPITCEKFKVSRDKVENLISSLASADRNGKKACENEYRHQWDELRRGGISERVTLVGSRRGAGLVP